ncbi:MAG: single-stranded-DNA-specific exonuclease RecJ, partial [Spirochaetes bacterium GWE2_31_10]
MKVLKKEIDIDFVKKWIDRGLNPIVLSILNRRGIKTDNDLYRFLNSNKAGMIPSPFIFEGIEKAYQRIADAVMNKEKILVFGDRDVDGVTSVHILTQFLKSINADVDFIVPVGADPYGVNPESIKNWPGKYGLVITVDCGITNVDEVAFLKQNGIDTIILDHHHVHEKIPFAYSIINPKYQINYEMSDMAACVVVFLFVMGWYFWKSEYFNRVYYIKYNGTEYTIKNLLFIESEKYDKDMTDYFSKRFVSSKTFIDDSIEKDELLVLFKDEIFKSIPGFSKIIESYIQFATLGTIADIMPLVGINRVIVSLGVDLIRKSPENAIKMLIEKNGIDGSIITATDIAWKITPILNSPGRMGDARFAVDFLASGSDNLATTILLMNDERRKQGDEAYNSLINDVDENAQLYDNKINVFESRSISRGVIGITANKISEFTGRPAIVCAVDDEITIGSMRGDLTCHLVEYLDGAKAILDEFGGHKFAAGFRLKTKNFEAFKEFVKQSSHLLISGVVESDGLSIDAEIPVQYLSDNLYSDISIIEPYGECNEMPLLYTKSITVENFSVVGKDQSHLKLTLNTGSGVLNAVYWGKAGWFKSLHNESN